MRTVLFSIFGCAILFQGIALAQQTGGASAKRAPGTHPDLSGVWTYAIDRAPAALKKEVNGTVTIQTIDQSARHGNATSIPGALPSAPKPSYKTEYQAKVRELSDQDSKLDPVFYCGKPGVPRIGSPRKIVQLPDEIIFFYEDISGDPYRIIPTDGRPHRANGNPSAYGDSVVHWEGGTLVVDVTNFTDDTWFGEGGYFHTDAMHVTERLWRVGENLAYQAI